MARKVMGALVAGALGTSPAMADVYESNVVQQLEAEGFRSISTERTWLGRTRITAESSDGQREIVINPNNGEVLRDLWFGGRQDGAAAGAVESVGIASSEASADAGRKDGESGRSGRNGGNSDDGDDRDRGKDRSRGDDKGRDRSDSESGRDGGRGGDGRGGDGRGGDGGDGGGDGNGGGSGGGSGGDNGGGSND